MAIRQPLTRFRHAGFFLLGFLFIVICGAKAQPTLNFKRIVVNWPTVELYFSVRCNGKLLTNLDKQFFSVYENGIKIGDFELWCPDTIVFCPVSAALVFDASGSMKGARNEGAKQAGHAFINMLDALDEAAVLFFNTKVTVVQEMTKDKGLLHTAVNTLPASGNTAVWDGAYSGIGKVLQDGHNPCKAVVVLTDGGDNSSSRSPAEIIAYAKANQVRVFTVRLGAGAPSAILRSIAEQTGGKYYDAPTPDQLTAIYEEIAQILGGGECKITYRGFCIGDGSNVRTVNLTALLCNGSDTRTRTYIAPDDPSMHRPIRIRAGTVRVKPDEEAAVPIELLDTLDNEWFAPFAFTVLYDESCMRFQRVEAYPPALFADLPITVSIAPGMLSVRSSKGKFMTANPVPARLLDLIFTGIDPAGIDTACCPLRFASWNFTGGCLRPDLHNGLLCVAPSRKAPLLRLQCAAPDSLHFNLSSDGYEPNPFTVAVSCVNRGSTAARDVTAFLHLPPGVEMADPGEARRKALPSPMLPWKAGDPIPSVSWTVRYTGKPRNDNFLNFRFVVGGLDDKGEALDSVETTCEVRVPGLSPSLACDIAMPDSLALDQDGTNLSPNPFLVTYHLRNTSRQTAWIMTVDLQYPSGEGLKPDISTPKTRAVNRALEPGDTLAFEWLLHAENRIAARDLRIAVAAYDDEGNAVVCAGRIHIPAMQPVVRCDVTASETHIRFISGDRTEDTVRWTVSAAISNPGGFPLSELSAELYLLDSSQARLQTFDESYADNANPKTVPLLFPQGTKVFQWGLRLADGASADEVSTLVYGVRFKTKETPEPKQPCETSVTLEPYSTEPALACQLSAPDTIRFETRFYNPSPFELRLSIFNTGSATANNVRAFILQDTRFNAVSETKRDYGDLEAGAMIDFDDPARGEPFLMKVNPRAESGYDTVRVVVVADGAPAAMCMYPIYVERERRPGFALSCRAIPDRLEFDERSGAYVPDPFEVVTTAVNTGDTEARDCVLLFVGPPRFTPADQSPIAQAGVLHPGDTARASWKLSALPRSTGGWDTLVYQVQGRGGLGDRLIIGECRVPVHVPAARVAAYTLSCDSPDTLHFDLTTGAYVPDPFEFTARVVNSGHAEGFGVAASLQLPPGLVFADGESMGKSLPDLPPGDSATVTWRLRPVAFDGGPPRTLEICARIADAAAREATCCATTVIPPAVAAAISVSCRANPDILLPDKQRGGYQVNPVTVEAVISNRGERPAFNVRLQCLPRSNGMRVIGAYERLAAASLAPRSASDTMRWEVFIEPRDREEWLTVGFVAVADGLAPAECAASIFAPAVEPPSLQCDIHTSLAASGEVLRFDRTAGDYRDDEGTRSATGRYNVFVLSAVLSNTGETTARNASATLLPPQGIMLDAGESASQLAGDIAPGGNATVSWRLRPIREPLERNRFFAVLTASDNSAQNRCFHEIKVEGAPKIVRVSLPMNPVGRYGDNIVVPVYVDTTIGADVYAYRLNIRFDPRLLRFLDAASVNSLTAYGWSGPRAVLYREKGSSLPNVVRLQDFTSGSPLAYPFGGVLSELTFKAVYEEATGAVSSPVQFVRMLSAEEGGVDKIFALSMNSNDEASAGDDIQVECEDGMITVSGDCVLPLTGTPKFSLSQNSPNPFNPSTIIVYELGTETYASLTVIDPLGRIVSTLTDARQPAGKYSIRFDASRLPSGVYLYKLETTGYVKTLRMVKAQ